MEKKLPKIVYVTNVRLPTEKAHGLSTVKLSEALAQVGYEVDIITPFLWRKKERNIFKHYGVKKNFKIFKVPTIDLMPLGIPEKIAFIIQIFSFSIFAFFYVLIKYRGSKKVLYFSHDCIPLYFLTFMSDNIFYDVHHFPKKNFIYRRVMKKAKGFSVQTKWKVKELGRKWGINKENIVYWPNGTDVDSFKLNISKNDAKKQLNLSVEKKIVLYTGQLFDWKGVDTLVRAISVIQEDSDVYIVGGSKKDIEAVKERIKEAANKRIKFIPFQSHKDMPVWLCAADVLVLPNTGKQKVSLYYTSPMKLFEYMASGTPIVASDIPSITEILNTNNAFLAEADNSNSFGDVINKVLSGTSADTEKIAQKSQEDVRKYTWRNRAEKIRDLIKSKQ